MDGSVPEALRRTGGSLDIESGGTRARAAVLTTVSTAWADRVHPHVFYFHISNVPALTASNPNQVIAHCVLAIMHGLLGRALRAGHLLDVWEIPAEGSENPGDCGLRKCGCPVP